MQNLKLVAAAVTAAGLLAACGSGTSGDSDATARASGGAAANSSSQATSATSALPTVAGSKLSRAGTAPRVSPPAAGLPTGFGVAPNFFGVHDASPVSGADGWPRAPIGSLRIWDAGVSWRQIETSPGTYDFTRFDAIIKSANANRAETLIVLGQTPQFYASKVMGTDVNGPGSASMPKDLNAWKRYVAAVANRPGVRGNRYVQFQVWNEANVKEFWNGSPAQMALLTKLTRDALGRSRYLLAPAMVTRNSVQRTWMDKFYATKVNRRPVADYVNAVSLQLYPLPGGKPEDSMAILALDKKILAKYRVNKPIWNTEVNYGLSGRRTAGLSANLQAANVSRTYLLNAAAGIKRTFWYSWNLQDIANTRMVARNGYTLTSAGKAYGVTRSWLVSSQVRSCTRDRQGTYTCTITYRGGVRRVFWNPTKAVTVAVAGATTHQLVDGTTRTYSPRTMRLKVGPAPVMIRSAR